MLFSLFLQKMKQVNQLIRYIIKAFLLHKQAATLSAKAPVWYVVIRDELGLGPRRKLSVPAQSAGHSLPRNGMFKKWRGCCCQVNVIDLIQPCSHNRSIMSQASPLCISSCRAGRSRLALAQTASFWPKQSSSLVVINMQKSPYNGLHSNHVHMCSDLVNAFTQNGYKLLWPNLAI